MTSTTDLAQPTPEQVIFLLDRDRGVTPKGKKRIALSNGNHNLSEDIMVCEILSRLPVKSVIRFKCVCKYWYTLFKDPSFISKHQQHRGHDSAHFLVLHDDDYSSSNNYLFSVFADSEMPMMPPPTYTRKVYHKVVIGPLDGIFCLYDGFSNVFLWNPATRELVSVEIPYVDEHPPMGMIPCSRQALGFGLDPRTNVYKLVRIFVCRKHSEMKALNPVHVMVYNLGTKSWRYFKQVLHISYLYKSHGQTYKNGVYYWLGSDKDINAVIVSFDMSNEMLRTIMVSFSSIGALRVLSLYDESIAMIIRLGQEKRYYYDIWVMKEEEDCWSKHLRIGPFKRRIKFCGFWNKNVFLLDKSNYQLILYDPYSQQHKNLGVWDRTLPPLRVFVYKESLASFSNIII